MSGLRPEDPSHVGGYELLGRLGAGGMGVVYKARARDGRLVAVKVINRELAGDQEFRGRFRSEVARARQVPPFCTAEVLDADPEAPQPYLVVEFVDGPSLHDEVTKRGPLSAANLHGLAIGVATALSAIHDAGVIHRDLKPHNVLLAPGTPKVIDFGIARALEPTTQHTRTGEVVGTLNYMAPERFGDPGTPLTPAADVFAWGCVVAYASQGRAPFDAESPVAIFGRIMGGEPTLGGGLGGPLRTLVRQALRVDPAHRPTARQLVEALLNPDIDRTAALHDVFARQPEMRTAVDEVRAHRTTPGRTFAGRAGVVPPDTDPRPAPSEEPKRNRRPRVLIAAAAGLALVGGLGFAARSGFGATADETNGAAKETSSSPSAAPTFLLPAGKVQMSDPLVVGGFWETKSVQDGKTYCKFADDRLQIQTLDVGVWQCQGPTDLDLKGTFAVEVTGRIDQAQSCLGVWLAYTPSKMYRLEVCTDVWRLVQEDQGSGDDKVLRAWPDTVAALGKEVKLQMAVENDVVRVGHDGVPVGEQALPQKNVTGGDFSLGVISKDSATKGPFRDSFTDIEIRLAS